MKAQPLGVREVVASVIANHSVVGRVSWEIYGDPGDDPATLEVQVFYILY